MAPRTPAAAFSLALRHSDYPRGAVITTRPSTNAQAEQYLGPAHWSTFDQLHRIDGAGWLQLASWHFKTGKGGLTRIHQTVFGYGVNVFHTSQQAQAALTDVKISPHPWHTGHLRAWLFRSSDAHQTLVFIFFAYRAIEVEAYYQYTGMAPERLAHSLDHLFGRQSAHLVRLVRRLATVRNQTPTPTSSVTPSPAPTATATSTPTPTVITSTATPMVTPTPSPRPTPTPAATATPSPSPTPQPTATPAGLVVQAGMVKPSYAPGEFATLSALVTQNGTPLAKATIVASFDFPAHFESCTGTTGPNGIGSCSVLVPDLPDETVIQVAVQVAAPDGQSVIVQTSFSIDHTAS